MFAVYQFWINTQQSKTTFEDSISKEYRDIFKNIPYSALIGKTLIDEEVNQATNGIYNYMDFCNEQIFLRKTGRVRKDTWNNWQEGMCTNFLLPIFVSVSKEVFEELPNIFTELRRVMAENYSTDPKKWK
ncbi:hypothetical protein [Psychrobacter urativorans]|uniref:Uncharacterized protein n=1 Tax=Psychrobacter urativorans TaxID=45610 RepID=A0A0M4U6J5_9GAMM|nr:hypothetical protein [Psychrobacter urativorans]ALF60781.1 hypothetical protein AOC03_06045 [Psychrobacter urativorans]